MRVAITSAANRNRLVGARPRPGRPPGRDPLGRAPALARPTRRSSRRPGLSYTVRIGDVAAQGPRQPALASSARRPASVGERQGARRRDPERPHLLPHAGQEIENRAEDPRRAATRPRAARSRCPALLGGPRDLGVEIAENVDATDDGRPYYVQVGTHHAREWPANEATLEWGLELDQRLQGRQRPRIAGHRQGRAQLRHPGAQRRRLRRDDPVRGHQPRRQLRRPGQLGLGRAATRARRLGRLQAQELPARGRRARAPVTPHDCLARSYPSDRASDRRRRRGPQPQLRRRVGRPGHRRQPVRGSRTSRPTTARSRGRSPRRRRSATSCATCSRRS